MALKWTKTSGPDYWVMNPKPLSPLNHLTVPVVMDIPSIPGPIRTHDSWPGGVLPQRELPATALRTLLPSRARVAGPRDARRCPDEVGCTFEGVLARPSTWPTRPD